MATLPSTDKRNDMKPRRIMKVRRPHNVYMNPKLTAIRRAIAYRRQQQIKIVLINLNIVTKLIKQNSNYREGNLKATNDG